MDEKTVSCKRCRRGLRACLKNFMIGKKSMQTAENVLNDCDAAIVNRKHAILNDGEE